MNLERFKNRHGNIDIRNGVPTGCYHLPSIGVDLHYWLYKANIEYIPAMNGFTSYNRHGKRHVIFDGVVIAQKDKSKILNLLQQRCKLPPNMRTKRELTKETYQSYLSSPEFIEVINRLQYQHEFCTFERHQEKCRDEIRQTLQDNVIHHFGYDDQIDFESIISDSAFLVDDMLEVTNNILDFLGTNTKTVLVHVVLPLNDRCALDGKVQIEVPQPLDVWNMEVTDQSLIDYVHEALQDSNGDFRYDEIYDHWLLDDDCEPDLNSDFTIGSIDDFVGINALRYVETAEP